MKHWDGLDEDVAPLRLSRRERRRIRAMFAEQPAGRRQEKPHVGSLIGLALALAVVAGLAWAVAPVDPVSSKLMH